MSIKAVVSAQKEPTGVFISLDDWNVVAPLVNQESELFKIMAGLTFKSMFDMTDEEIQAKARLIAEKAKNAAWAHGLPISYKNETCAEADLIIHEYKTGEKELVSVSAENGAVKKLRRL